MFGTSDVLNPHYRCLEGEEKDKKEENLFEYIIAANFPSLRKRRDLKPRKYRVPNKMDPRRSIPKHITKL